MEKISNLKLNISISPAFEANFRYLMSEVADTEWGGVVVYDMKNSFLDDEIDIELLDFMLLDIGSVAETSHTYAENPELTTLLMSYLGKPYGLIHSHVTGEVYYSGTDTKEIIEREKYYPQGYLSVVTNTKGDILVRISKYFETLTTTVLKVGSNSRKSSKKTKSLHYAESKININSSTKSIDDRITLLQERTKKLELANKQKFSKGKHFNNINKVVNFSAKEETEQEIHEREMQDYFDKLQGYGAAETRGLIGY